MLFQRAASPFSVISSILPEQNLKKPFIFKKKTYLLVQGE